MDRSDERDVLRHIIAHCDDLEALAIQANQPFIALLLSMVASHAKTQMDIDNPIAKS